MLNCVQETCRPTRKKLYKIDRHTCKFLVTEDMHKFLVGLYYFLERMSPAFIVAKGIRV